MKAAERFYSTTDGKIVREGDPRGAYLAYAIGDTIGEDHAGQVSKLVAPVADTSRVYHDDEARDKARVMVAEPTRENRAVVADHLGDDPTTPVLMHDRLATELADEARERANRDESLEDSDTATKVRLYWNADRDQLLPEGHMDSAFLAYAPGDKIRRGHLDMYEAVQDDQTDGEKREATPTTTADPNPDANPDETATDPATGGAAPSATPAKKATGRPATTR